MDFTTIKDEFLEHKNKDINEYVLTIYIKL